MFENSYEQTVNTENKYLKALINNDTKITSEIYAIFFPRIATFISKNNGNYDDAKDVFQDALIYLVYITKEKSLQVKSFEAYLFTICKNIWRRRLKNRKVRIMNEEKHTLEDRMTTRSLIILEEKRLELYNESFAQLSENCKEVLAIYFNTLDYQELLRTFSYNSVDVARQRVYRCRKKLIDFIKLNKKYHTLK